MKRVASIDIVRGAVMVLMAIDHVRVYAGVPAGGPSPDVFFTRWVTHFCAPAFVFLAGTAAFLAGRKMTAGALSRFLLVRGIWLVLLELTVIRLMWTFNVQVTHLLAGVIWVIGWSMIVMALLVRLPLAVVAIFGVATIALHNLVTYEGGGALWQIVYAGGPIGDWDNGPVLFVLYSLIPWVGVMAAGYAFGAIVHRRRLMLAIGIGATILFVVLRMLNGYGDPRPWKEGLSFLNTTKYPASLDFLLMTLGPTIAAIPLLENARGRVARWLEVFGRVPLFYYLLHIPLIHLAALVVSLIRTGAIEPWLFGNHPAMIGPAPDGYRWSLGLLYLVWLVCVVLLYFPSRWFAGLKARRTDGWLRYV
ncbi:MAG TPA: heparan-alpha-glucosaminide N-acetyltransferase domain-containing protein [Thermoanaerobaculia bacterium]|nr:heparan-alpha-glucosaminide N-acetyltransferase domain-containing protein [Thermoanaerobaculia bacterium]